MSILRCERAVELYTGSTSAAGEAITESVWAEVFSQLERRVRPREESNPLSAEVLGREPQNDKDRGTPGRPRPNRERQVSKSRR
jgi:hypothetical protein